MNTSNLISHLETLLYAERQEPLPSSEESTHLRKQRSCTVDVIRIVATLLVLSVHFFLRTGFYSHPMAGERMYVMTLIRSVCMTCVPLFMMLTGYLCSRKTLSAHYYKGVIKTAGIYVLVSLACAVWLVTARGQTYTFVGILNGLRTFTLAGYSWYIEMYFGLFLITPFLNQLYHGLETKRKKQVLLATMIFLTAIPVFITWWIGIYPVTYYLLGAYIREHGFRLKKRVSLALLLGTNIALATKCFFDSYGGNFQSLGYQTYGALPCLIMTVMIFGLILSIPTERWPDGVKTVLAKIADLCLGTYLISVIFDHTFYPIFNEYVVKVPLKLEYMPLMVLLVFLCSLGSSWVINLIYTLLQKMVQTIISRVKAKTAK